MATSSPWVRARPTITPPLFRTLPSTSLTLNNAGPSFLSRAGVKVGDTVLLPDYGGQAVNLGDMGASKDKETFLYSDQEILGIVESS